MRTLLLLAVGAAAWAHAAWAQKPGGTLYLGSWPATVHIFDEAQQKAVGKIDLKTGVPRSLMLSNDRKLMVATTTKDSGIEVIDLASRQVTSHFVLNTETRKYRLGGMALNADATLLYANLYSVTKKIDRFEVDKNRVAVIDLAARKIVREHDLPKELEPNAGARFGALRVAPDGKHIYYFRENIFVLDATTFKLVDTIDLSKPVFPGMERVFVGFGDDPHEDPNTLLGIFNTTDPHVHRRVFGIARFDLNKRSFDFKPVAPATTGMMGLHMTPDRMKGYTVAFNGDGANRRSEFWEFDLTSRELKRKAEFAGRTRFNFTISPSGRDLYVFGAGFEIEVFDAATFQPRRTIDVGADITTNMVALPR
ncbi:MAG: hypothetical protein FJW40_01905 [Acidobacteria bacterium]|nr:hypothetical protein [Acidobacteriota bacterium]